MGLGLVDEAENEAEVGWRLPKGLTKRVTKAISKVDYKKHAKNLAGQIAAGIAFDQAMSGLGLYDEAENEAEVGRFRFPKGLTKRVTKAIRNVDYKKHAKFSRTNCCRNC